MKVILSRKGLDSSFKTGVASPILPDGTMLPLPIPEDESETVTSNTKIRYSDLAINGHNLGEVISDLTGNPETANICVHLDPDLHRSVFPRAKGWRRVFGQAGSAQGHLRNQKVSIGDIFLFFGWFRKADKVNGRYRYTENAPDIHVIFGWLQVEEILKVEWDAEIYSWLSYHPHHPSNILDEDGKPRASYKNNNIYIAADEITFGSQTAGLPGGGYFNSYSDRLRLSAEGASRSLWRLPKWFYPSEGNPPLTYHGKADGRWVIDGDSVLLRSAGRGQEFVLDEKHFPESTGWIVEILSCESEGSIFDHRQKNQ